jgi:hypothetical protein
MEDENENENNNSFISIFGSDNIITEKSFLKDFNNEKNTISYLDSNYFFNDYNNESKPTNDETNLSEQNKINLFENEKKIEIFSDFDEFNPYENLEKKPNKIHFEVNNVNNKLYNAKKEYLFKKMFTITTEILIKEINEKLINKKLKKVKLISEYNYNNYKICLNKKIKELLSKNEKNEKNINLVENNEQNLNEEILNILNMKLNEFIFINDKTINEKYEKFFNNEFLKYFKGAISFKKKCNSIKKLINEINNNKGNKKNKKD